MSYCRLIDSLLLTHLFICLFLCSLNTSGVMKSFQPYQVMTLCDYVLTLRVFHIHIMTLSNCNFRFSSPISYDIYIYIYIYKYTYIICLSDDCHAGHCWRSRDELISDVLLWTPTYGWAKAGRPAQTYIQQLCEDMGCSPEDLLETMNDREKWRESVRDIHANGTTWWWWWWLLGYFRF